MRCLFFLLLALTVMTSTHGATVLDRTIAKLNEDILTESDLAEIMADASGQLNTKSSSGFTGATSETVQGMFDRALLVQEARRLKINPPSDEMNRQVETMVREIRANFSSEKEFHQALASERISLNQLKQELLERSKTDFMVYHVVNSRYSVSESDVKAFEAQDSQTSKPSVSYRLRRLGIAVTQKDGAEAARHKAREIVSQIITDGITFEEGIRKYSQVAGAAADAGDMGYMSADKLNSDVRAAVENLEVGQASVPIIAGGYANIFYVEGKRGAKSAVREQKFFDARGQLLDDLRRKANLQIFDDRLTPLLPASYRGALRAMPVTGASIEDTPLPARDNAGPANRPGTPGTRSIQITPVPQGSPAFQQREQSQHQEQQEQPASTGLRRWFGGNRQ